jgi:lipoprotein-releasing system permease protein
LKLPVFIAKRYLISKKSFNIINIISLISLVGVVVGTMALIVILSVFNGFEDLVSQLYNTFDADIEITSKEGKVFLPSDIPAAQIKAIEGTISYTEVLKGSVLMRYDQEQYIAELRGVSDNYLIRNPIEENIIEGDFNFKYNNSEALLLGYYIAYKLGISLDDPQNFVEIFSPNRKARNFSDINTSFVHRSIVPGGIFSIQQDIDSKYVMSSLAFARKIFQYEEEVSAIEIRYDSLVDVENIQSRIKQIIPDNYVVKNRYEQQEALYKVMRTEKWFIFFILIFILVIAIFNLVSSLTMLILDKVKDLSLLYGMGLSIRQIRRIFIVEGMMIVWAGELLGLGIGALLCYLQQTFGLIRLGGNVNAFLVPYYPVQLHWIDIVLSIFSVSLIGFLASLIPIMRLKASFLEEQVLKNIRAH